MSTIKRIEERELKKIGRPGVQAASAPPNGISPVLRASWNFAGKWAQRFNKEMLNDRTKQFLDNLAKRFS